MTVHRRYVGREAEPGESTWRLPCGHTVAWIGFDIFDALRGRVDCETCLREAIVARFRADTASSQTSIPAVSIPVSVERGGNAAEGREPTWQE